MLCQFTIYRFISFKLIFLVWLFLTLGCVAYEMKAFHKIFSNLIDVPLSISFQGTKKL